MNRTEHHTGMSELGFTISAEDLKAVNQYAGNWVMTGEGKLPNNYWVVSANGQGHPVAGQMSPEEMLQIAKDKGWDPVYVAPYGRHVEGELDRVKLHDWIRQHRNVH
jgi:hypothetical protein